MTSCTPQATTVVTFNELETTTYGESLFLTGSISQIGDWSTSNAVSLSASQYTSSNPLWYAQVALPAGTTFQYKYFKRETSGAVTWESDPNRQYTVPSNCAGTATENDSWR